MLNMNKGRWQAAGVLLMAISSIGLLTACSPESDTAVSEPPRKTPPIATTMPEQKQGISEASPLRNAYFGETHVHTAYSLDAYIGGTRLMPADAYRFAKGEAVTVDGEIHQRQRPLDFVAVTDHAEYIGEMYSTIVEGAPGHDQVLLHQLRNLKTIEEKQQWFLKYVVENNRGETPQHPPFFAGPDTVKSAWQLNIEAAEQHNEPGRFTAFIAYEWSAAPKGGNLQFFSYSRL